MTRRTFAEVCDTAAGLLSEVLEFNVGQRAMPRQMREALASSQHELDQMTKLDLRDAAEFVGAPIARDALPSPMRGFNDVPGSDHMAHALYRAVDELAASRDRCIICGNRNRAHDDFGEVVHVSLAVDGDGGPWRAQAHRWVHAKCVHEHTDRPILLRRSDGSFDVRWIPKDDPDGPR